MPRHALNSRAVCTRRAALSGAAALAATLSFGHRPRFVSARAADGQMTTIDGAELYVEVHGRGEPLVLLHGLMGSSEQLANQIPAFAEQFRVIAIDGRGQGRSSRGSEPITYRRLAADVIGVMDRLGLTRAHVVGWSDGAIVALTLAVHFPARLRKLVMYGAAYVAAGVRLDPTFAGDVAIMGGPTTLDYLAIAPHAARAPELFMARFTMIEDQPDFNEAQLQAITAPTLILDGERDEVIAPDQAPGLARLIPGAKLVVMPDTGHFAVYDRPTEFNRIVLDFLKAPSYHIFD
jgi:pimeloyl-ACP methyl ester carboxylesterase